MYFKEMSIECRNLWYYLHNHYLGKSNMLNELINRIMKRLSEIPYLCRAESYYSLNEDIELLKWYERKYSVDIDTIMLRLLPRLSKFKLYKNRVINLLKNSDKEGNCLLRLKNYDDIIDRLKSHFSRKYTTFKFWIEGEITVWLCWERIQYEDFKPVRGHGL